MTETKTVSVKYYDCGHHDPYWPKRYVCRECNPEYIWFDEKKDSEDLEFTIDLENGSMDR
jgi:hypothetical protein